MSCQFLCLCLYFPCEVSQGDWPLWGCLCLFACLCLCLFLCPCLCPLVRHQWDAGSQRRNRRVGAPKGLVGCGCVMRIRQGGEVVHLEQERALGLTGRALARRRQELGGHPGDGRGVGKFYHSRRLQWLDVYM